MTLKERIKNLIEKYGFIIEVGTVTTTTNEYGEELDQTVNYIQEYAASNNTKTSFSLEQFGIKSDSVGELIVPFDTSITKDSRIRYNNTEFKVSSIEPVWFKNEVVVYFVELE